MKHPLTAAEIARRSSSGKLSQRHHEPTFWLRSAIEALYDLIYADQLPACVHLDHNPEQPAVLHLRTGDARCVPCAAQAPEPARCDRCAAEVDEIGEYSAVQFEPLLIVCALCPACRQREVGADW